MKAANLTVVMSDDHDPRFMGTMIQMVKLAAEDLTRAYNGVEIGKP